MDTLTLKKYDKIVWKAAHKLNKALPSQICYYVFGSDINDIYQQAWTFILKDKKTYTPVEFDSEAIGGLIFTSIYRDLLDHVRTVCGRENQNGKLGPSAKAKWIMGTINMENFPMSSDIGTGPNGMIDKDKAAIVATFDVGSRDDLDMCNFLLSKEIAEFMNKKLTVKDNYIARLSFVEGFTGKEIGQKLGITESRVSQIQTKFLETVQRHFDK